jgi:hypothetical protein
MQRRRLTLSLLLSLLCAPLSLSLYSAVFCAATFPNAARAEVLLAQDEAMEAAFGAGAQITSHTKKISSEQKHEIEELAQTTLTSSFLHYYEGHRNGEFLGYAVIDSRVMRTNLAIFMVLISKDLVVQKVILLAFHEPSEYQPADGWLKLLEGAKPMEDLVPGQGLAPIAGSTLTVNGLSDGVRAVRASFEVLLKEAHP